MRNINSTVFMPLFYVVNQVYGFNSFGIMYLKYLEVVLNMVFVYNFPIVSFYIPHDASTDVVFVWFWIHSAFKLRLSQKNLVVRTCALRMRNTYISNTQWWNKKIDCIKSTASVIKLKNEFYVTTKTHKNSFFRLHTFSRHVWHSMFRRSAGVA